MKRRILIFSHEFPPYLGGVGVVGAQLATFLAEQGIEVHVMTRALAGREAVPGVVFHDVEVLPKFWFLSYRRALAAVDLKQFDAIILNEAAPTIVAGKYFDRATLARCVVLLHGLEIESLYRGTPANMVRRLFGFASAHRRACQMARRVVAVSDDMRTRFRAETGIESIEVLNMGANSRVFKPGTSHYRQERKIPAETFVIVSGGRVVAEKGFGEMLEAFTELAKQVPDIRWVICGDGDYAESLVRSVRKKGIENKVIFEGQCTQSRLAEIYNDSDVFWLISNYREAFPLAYIEAQLTGLPTAGRNLGGTIEAIAPEITGWLVEDANECVGIFREYAKRRDFDRSSVAEAAAPYRMDNALKAIMPLLA
ncbi:MAG: glycosyltransferase family 4 protein [Pseudomonadales bacterium]|nr:glycosyltransferase family 4 protein [Pseudomonadales bacterium]